MRHPKLLIIISLILTIILVGAAGCTRKRPVPTPVPTSTRLAAPTATTVPTPGEAKPQVTRAAIEEEAGGQPAAPMATAAAPPTPASVPEQVQTRDYMVQPGETLFSIAQRLGTDVDVLRRLNNLTNDTVQPGQVIKVPASAPIAAPTAPQTPGQPIEHIVQRGEYLKLIADKYGVSPEAIIRANNLQNPNFLYPGQKLIIPAPGTTSAPSSGRPRPRRVHVVQRGETLQSIALKYGVTVSELAEANGITNPNLIYVGQKLIIP